MESPETRFDDLVVADIRNPVASIPLDIRFVKVCEPGTLRIRCAVSEDIGLGHSRCELKISATSAAVLFEADGEVTNLIRSKGVIRVAITITGIRLGHTARFRQYTKEQAEQNTAFWDQATAKR